jgi:hypothetical protein
MNLYNTEAMMPIFQFYHFAGSLTEMRRLIALSSTQNGGNHTQNGGNKRERYHKEGA